MDERHGLADFLEEELPKLRAQWEAGSYRALIRAFGWCAGNGYKFPKWLSEAVRDEMLYSMANRGRGGTKKGNAVSRQKADSAHQVRFLLVEQYLAFQQAEIDAGRRLTPLSEIEAARDAQRYLAASKHPAAGTTAETIRRSYKR